jgi:hypothetical protein
MKSSVDPFIVKVVDVFALILVGETVNDVPVLNCKTDTVAALFVVITNLLPYVQYILVINLGNKSFILLIKSVCSVMVPEILPHVALPYPFRVITPAESIVILPLVVEPLTTPT